MGLIASLRHPIRNLHRDGESIACCQCLSRDPWLRLLRRLDYRPPLSGQCLIRSFTGSSLNLRLTWRIFSADCRSPELWPLSKYGREIREDFESLVVNVDSLDILLLQLRRRSRNNWEIAKYNLDPSCIQRPGSFALRKGKVNNIASSLPRKPSLAAQEAKCSNDLNTFWQNTCNKKIIKKKV